MPPSVKVSDRLLALVKKQAQRPHRPAAGQVEDWETLRRAAEVVLADGDVLALERFGEQFPTGTPVTREDVYDALNTLTQDSDRTKIRARIKAAGTPIYATDPVYPGRIVEIRADGTRRPGQLKGRRFIADPPAERAQEAEKTFLDASRKPLAQVEGRRRMRLSGVTVTWRGTPNLDDWVAYIVKGTRSKKLVLADHASEQKVKSLLSRLQTLSREDIEKLSKS